MKKILSLLLCLCLLCTLMGCGNNLDGYTPTGDGLAGEGGQKPGNNQEGTDKLITLTYFPERGTNPYTCTDYTNRALLGLLFQSLFSVDSSYNLHPVLCREYTVSKDGRTHTFTLTDDASFSDGTPVTAEDVLASLQAAKKSILYSGRMIHMTNFSLSGENGVVIRTDTEYATNNLPLLLDIPIVPALQVEEANPIGSGPYTLMIAITGSYLQKRTNWWCSADLPVTTSAIPLLDASANLTGTKEEESAIRDSFQYGKLDFAFTNPSSDYYVDYMSDFELWDCESGIFLYIGCNEDSLVFDNEALRAALTYAIDRDSLSAKFYRGFAQSATLPASPTSPFYSKALAGKYGYNAAKFAEAVKNTGKSGSEIVFLVNSDDSLRVRVGRAIAQMLRDCGLQVTVSELGGTGYTNAVKRRQFDLYLGQTKLSPNMDLSAFFHLKGALSYGGVDDVAAYSLCLNALADQGNYYTLHRMVMERGLLCPVLFCNYAIYTTRGAFPALNPTRENPFFYTIGKTLPQ